MLTRTAMEYDGVFETRWVYNHRGNDDEHKISGAVYEHAEEPELSEAHEVLDQAFWLALSAPLALGHRKR